MKYMISACLMGENCKYNGGNNKQEALIAYMKDKDYVCACPEQLGGLPTPRECCEIVGEKVITQSGNDVSEQFLFGARKAIALAKEENIDCVITQSRSPSCGMGSIYDGSFHQCIIKGNGVFVQELLLQHIKVMDYFQFYQKIIEKQAIYEEITSIEQGGS